MDPALPAHSDATCARIAHPLSLLIIGHDGFRQRSTCEETRGRRHSSWRPFDAASEQSRDSAAQGGGSYPASLCRLKSSAGCAPGDHYLDAPILLPAGLGPF